MGNTENARQDVFDKYGLLQLKREVLDYNDEYLARYYGMSNGRLDEATQKLTEKLTQLRGMSGKSKLPPCSSVPRDELSAAYSKHLTRLRAHPLILGVNFYEGRWYVRVKPLRAVSKHPYYFQLGGLILAINLEQNEVTFMGDRVYHCYWNNLSPHPHVSGQGSHACLGNAAEPLSYMAANGMLYDYVMLCLDFLQSVNVDDSAGRYVGEWPRVNQAGKLLPPFDINEEDEERRNEEDD